MAIRVEAHISGVRQIGRQRCTAAANIEDFFPRANEFGNAPEFCSRILRGTQKPMKIPAPVKVQVESFISGQHRLEKSQSTGRFPQSKMVDTRELPFSCHAKSPTPQPGDQPGADPLNAAARRKTGDRT